MTILRDIFLVFYGGVTVLSLIACCYLLLRRANAIAPDVKSPVRLRRWTAALFAAMTLSHLWYLPMYLHTSGDDVGIIYIVGGWLDTMTVFPLAIVVLLAMLQDRRRPLWPVCMVVAPLVVVGAQCVVAHSVALLPFIYVYFLLMCIGIIIYMVREVRQYDRWLRDNYADLEHKEVWQSLVVLGVTLLSLAVYMFEIGGQAHEYVMQTVDIVIVCYLLWRAETLSELSCVAHTAEEACNYESVSADNTEKAEESEPSLSIRYNIGQLLKQYCEDSQLYLQNDISLSQLAMHIGINRVYLSKHFALQGTTYNAYINSLRIQHFISTYHEAAESHQPITVQQLAFQCGFRSYGTFNNAFKQSMGMTAKEWMRTVAK